VIQVLGFCYKLKYEFIYAGKRETRESFWKHGFSLFVRGSSATVLQSTSGWCDQRKPEDIGKASLQALLLVCLIVFLAFHVCCIKVN